MSRFVIGPHMRLHEWIAEDKGYFADAGLDYEFAEQLNSKEASKSNLGDKVGAYQTFERGDFEGIKSSIFLEVEGAGHYLPKYAGNLDIMTSAALRTAERVIARRMATA